ncbi:hypothetical protein ACFQ7B_07710 [Streptomyces erythrochromogenes]|uniref:hypothetical protein n=1 Tax=Streptomyces erythrochromogenes TaxID=285574 RepID=UPI0036905892
MTTWLRTNRRLRSEAAYLREELAKAKEQPAPLIVTAGPRPGPQPGRTPAAPPPPPAAVRTEVEEKLRAELRTLQELRTEPGTFALAQDRRVWRHRARALDERCLELQADNESLTRELHGMTARATAAEEQLARVSRTAELRVGTA